MRTFLFIFIVMFVLPMVFMSTSWNIDSYDGPYPLLLNKDALEFFTLIGLYCISFLVLQIIFALADSIFGEKAEKWTSRGNNIERYGAIFCLSFFPAFLLLKPTLSFFTSYKYTYGGYYFFDVLGQVLALYFLSGMILWFISIVIMSIDFIAKYLEGKPINGWLIFALLSILPCTYLIDELFLN
jgi:hypothetical protein